MANFPESPRLVHGGFVCLDPQSLKPARIVAFQYNPETLSRTLVLGAAASVGIAPGSTAASGILGAGPLGPGLNAGGLLGGLLGSAAGQTSAHPGAIPAQFITFSLLFDATDQLQFPDQNPNAARYGVYPLLSAIEALLYPPHSSSDSLTLFVWGSDRILPVRLSQLQIVEQMFDPSLNPIRVEIQVTLVVRTDADFPKGSPFRKYWEDYLNHSPILAGLSPNASLGDLGLTNLP
jgi:hypothetical protein